MIRTTLTMILVGGLMAYLIMFLGINLILNCQTWDSSLWTETSSCVMPLQLLGL
jgi:hypothetical protein